MVKHKKKNLAERVNLKTNIKRSSNPFEVHVNKQKFNVLGRQLKTDKGLPGVSKAKALKKRKATLLQEYKVLNKNNKFFDRRIGEKNSAMTAEDKIIARFSAERMKAHKRKAIFNLADDEVLTHKGQSIAEIENFEDPIVSDDEDYNESKGLDANFVEEANFGGGTLRESKTSRAAIIDQLIAESKKRKAERQMAKEKTLQKTEELDAEWKELLPYVNMGKQEDLVDKKDSYDVLMNELKFEPRGTPSNKLKSEAEIAEEEANKLRELEEERLRRMRGEEPNSTQKKQHRSADDLDDGLDIEEESFELTYDKDGNPIGLDKLNDNEVIGKKKEAPDFGSDEENESDEESGEDNDSAEEEDDPKDSENADIKDPEKDEENNEDSSGDESDNLSDLQVTDDAEEKIEVDSEDEIENESFSKNESNKISQSEGNSGLEVKKKNKKSTKDKLNDKDNSTELEDCKEVETNLEDLENKIKEKKKVSFSKDVTLVTYKKEHSDSTALGENDAESDKLKKMQDKYSDIPYAIEAPGDYEELTELFKDRTPEQQTVIVERIIKCNHPSLNEKNKEKLENLFALLMQHLNDASESEAWDILNLLAPQLFVLTQFSPNNAAFCLGEVINEKHSDFLKKKHKYPSQETYLFLKLVPLLFPTSDKRHQVTTPSFIFLCEMLRYCNVTTRRTISAGLFLVSLVTEYIWLSKRVMPEALNFLSGVICMASPLSDLPVLSPFKKEHKFLFLQKSAAGLKVDLTMSASDFMLKGPKIDDEFRVRSIYCALKLLHLLAESYEEIAESKLLFKPIMNHLDFFEIKNYPSSVREAYYQLIEILVRINNKEMVPLMLEAKKPKALRLYEPSIQPVYEYQKKKLVGEKAEHTKLLYKYKKEMKGALREIRRDRSFIANVKFKEQAASDAERKRKVQEIYSWGAQQESEFKKLKRKKK
ncbi:unnamed protein product [Nezara viridula]|uniref:Nucleolar protein 14 n=1 Tax=Nezara viridula TaxID=85310 RepID=A0A9P0HLV1_NEZVI|nr:unnamed protein product [Nezara viridula]